jgi:hypothetical protein
MGPALLYKEAADAVDQAQCFSQAKLLMNFNGSISSHAMGNALSEKMSANSM